MQQALLLDYSRQAGFEVIASETFSFSAPDSDGVTLLRKPA